MHLAQSMANVLTSKHVAGTLLYLNLFAAIFEAFRYMRDQHKIPSLSTRQRLSFSISRPWMSGFSWVAMLASAAWTVYVVFTLGLDALNLIPLALTLGLWVMTGSLSGYLSKLLDAPGPPGAIASDPDAWPPPPKRQ